MRSIISLGFLSLVSACGGTSPDMQYPKAPPSAVQAEVVNEQPAPPGTLWRDQVSATLDQGLGTFLGHVDVEPSLDDGHFTGFRIVKLIPTAYWERVGLEPGDVVTRVNGMPIERETEAYSAFESLRTASELRVSYLRAGKPGELVYKIVDRGVQPAPSPAQPSAPKAAATSSSINVATPTRSLPDTSTKPPTEKK